MWQVSALKITILFSGGVESTCLMYYYLREGWLVYPLYVKAGYPWEVLMPLRVVLVLNPEKVSKRDHEKKPFHTLEEPKPFIHCGQLCTT